MSDNSSTAYRQQQSLQEESYLERADGRTSSISSKKDGDQKMVPVQFYMTNDMKKRLKMYCLSNDTKMSDILNKMTDEFLKSQGF